MDVAVMVDGQEDVSWRQWSAIAMACEAGGYQALFAADHYAPTYDRARGALDAWGVVTTLSVLTQRIRLGVLVSPPTFRHPSVLARLAVTADHVSKGRIELEIISRQWSEGEFAFHGRHYQLDGCQAFPKPCQQPRLPIVIGGSAKPRTSAPAARFADEYNTTFGATPQACRQRRKLLDEACMRIGRDPATLHLSAMIEFVLVETTEQVTELLELIARRQGLASSGEFLATDGAGGESMLVGTPEAVRDRLREYADAGVDRVVLQHLLHDQDQILSLAAREVLPAL